jgi:hypothetical protein
MGEYGESCGNFWQSAVGNAGNPDTPAITGLSRVFARYLCKIGRYCLHIPTDKILQKRAEHLGPASIHCSSSSRLSAVKRISEYPYHRSVGKPAPINWPFQPNLSANVRAPLACAWLDVSSLGHLIMRRCPYLACSGCKTRALHVRV